MRSAPVRILAALLPAALAGAASAHFGDIVYPIYELPTSDLPDLHDGTLEDWEEVLPNASLNHNEFQLLGGPGEGIDPSDLACRVFLAWHHASQRIYMAVERLDDVYLDPSVERDALTALMVDGDHSGGQFIWWGDAYSEEERKRLNEAQAQLYSVGPEPIIEDRLLVGGSWARPLVSLPPWATVGGFQYGESPKLSVVEFAVTAWDDLDWRGPELSTRSDLEAGKTIGFWVWVFDKDERPVDGGIYALPEPIMFEEAPTGSSNHFFAENSVDGELTPCYQGDCSGATTAVSQDSWGRIKASFR